MNEDTLIEQLLAHRERLMAYVRSKVSSHGFAEDLLQESLLKALRAAPSLRDDERLLPWFYTILNNAITDSYRRDGVASRLFTTFDPTEHDFPAPDSEEAKVVCECFRDLLPTLKPEYSDLIQSLDLLGEEPAQAAERLGLSPNTLKVRRHRARQALRRRLEEACRSCAKHGCLDCTCRDSPPGNEISRV